MQEITSTHPDLSVRVLLSYATSLDKVDTAYSTYLNSPNQHLFAYIKENVTVGCIGIEINGMDCEIKHIAVAPQERGRGVGSSMIHYLIEKCDLNSITAETDDDAVEFYRKVGFRILSLGEKYPGVVRYWCEYMNI